MGQVVFLYRSLAYRHAAAEMLRKARTLPDGSERSAAHRYAMALREVAHTEAWLEGRTADMSPPAHDIQDMQEARAHARRQARER
jgi:hypothetical protein